MIDRKTPLERLSDSDLELADGERDVRGLDVTDANGEEMGTVTGIYVDPTEAKVRFIQVRGGGVLGLGDREHIIPTEAIDRIDDDKLTISHRREYVMGGPTYDPTLVPQRSYWDNVYGYYGYPMFWGGAFPIGFYGGRI